MGQLVEITVIYGPYRYRLVSYEMRDFRPVPGPRQLRAAVVVVSISATDCPKRLVSELAYYVSKGTLKNSLTVLQPWNDTYAYFIFTELETVLPSSEWLGLS